MQGGVGRECSKCPAGKYALNSAFCKKCPIGTSSEEGSTKCSPCPIDSFADKEGSEQCIKCGTGTTSNAAKDGCDYNNCRYEQEPGVVYDLSPLKIDGGPMYRVWYNHSSTKKVVTQYFVNVCSLKHDNSSCMYSKYSRDGNGVLFFSKVCPCKNSFLFLNYCSFCCFSA